MCDRIRPQKKDGKDYLIKSKEGKNQLMKKYKLSVQVYEGKQTAYFPQNEF